MANKDTTISSKDSEIREIEPNIFALFFRTKNSDSKLYINKCVNKYWKHFDKNKRVLLKTFIEGVYNSFCSEDKECERSPEEETASFIECLCNYSMNAYDYINKKCKSGGEDFAFICKQLGNGIDICDLMTDYLTKESALLQNVPADNLNSYDKETQRIILLFYGEFGKSIDNSLVELLKKNIKDMVKNIETEMSFDNLHELIHKEDSIPDGEINEFDEMAEILEGFAEEDEEPIILNSGKNINPNIPIEEKIKRKRLI